MFGRGLEKAADFTAARKMLARRPQYDNAYSRIGVERLKRDPQLLALRQRDDV
jgi:hypothetical protein